MSIARASTVMTAALCIAVTVPAFAQTLREELSKLIVDHPQIKSALKGIESTRLEIDKSRARYFPTVTVDADYGAEVIDNPAERALRADIGGEPSSRTPSTAHLTVTQNLYDGSATDSAVKTARLNTAVRERRRTVNAEYFPTMDLVGSWNYEKHKGAVVGTRRDYSLLLSGTWDLFTGFSTQASLTQAAFDYRASKDNHDFVFRKVVEQTKLGWQALVTVRKRLELLESAVNIATEVFESRKKLRTAGKETVINVLDAENEVNNAQINFTSAAYDEKIAIYQLLLAMGRLNVHTLNLD